MFGVLSSEEEERLAGWVECGFWSCKPAGLDGWSAARELGVLRVAGLDRLPPYCLGSSLAFSLQF